MRVGVIGAGGPAGVNTCKALAAHEVVALDENPEHLIWCAPHAAETHAAEVTVETVNELACDVVIPQPDSLTMWLADHADRIEAKTFLPDRRTIALCQDKFEAGLAWRRAGLREDRVTLIDSALHHYHAEFSRFITGADQEPRWVRARRGAGAKAALCARNWAELETWVEFWQIRDDLDMLVEAFLPGRDLAWSSIWYEGELVCSFTRERLEYIYPGLTPEGLTGTPTIAEIVHDDAVNEVAEAAVRAVDATPHGIMSVDLREDAEGIPRPTEINAGRGFTTFGLWAMQAEENLYETILRFVCPHSVTNPDRGSVFCMECGTMTNNPLGPAYFAPGLRDCLPEGLKLYRHIDCGSFIYAPVPV